MILSARWQAASMAVSVLCMAWLVGCDQGKPADKPAPAAPQPAAAPAPGAEANLVEVQIKLPKPRFIGTPKQPPKDLPMEPPRKEGEKRPPLMAPPGTVNLAAGKLPTSSDPMPIIGELAQVTDGDKEGVDGSYVELGPGKQWVQIDLGSPARIWGIVVWHHHGDPRVYKDVVVQVSNDPEFAKDVATVYNNDHDDSSGFGVGKDLMYYETNEGKLIDVKGQATGRYVRLYSKGSTSDDQNHYTEVEVFGVPAR